MDDTFSLGQKIFSLFIFGFLILCLTTSFIAEAKTKSKKRRRDTGQIAVVAVDGAAVYKFANFDAPILDYLEKNKKIKISKKLYKGIGGLGTFFKVRLAKRKYGYIADVDVELGGKANQPNVKNQKSLKRSKRSVFNSGRTQRDPLFFTKFIGGTVGSVAYTEKVLDETKTANMTMYGLKMSGPDILFEGPVLDFELMVNLGAPSYYDEVASDDATGFLILGHLMALVALNDSPRLLLYGGLGISYLYAKFDVPVEAFSNIDSQEIRLGAVAGAGAGFLLTDKILLKLEAKYFYEVESYTGFNAALQFKY